MARIPYFDIGKAEGRAQRLYEKLPPLNIFRMLGHAGDLIDGFVRFGNQILAHTKLDPILREIAIIRVGVLSKASYEVYQHERIGRALGMSDAVVKAIHDGADNSAFSDLQRQVMRFTDDVVRNVRAGDAAFAPLEAALSARELEELVLTIGYYMLVSRFLENFDVEIEPAAASARLKLPGATY